MRFHPVVLCIGLMILGCEPLGGRSPQTAETVHVLMRLHEVRGPLLDYAKAHGGQYPESLSEIPAIAGKMNSLVYVGKGIRTDGPARIVIHAQPEKFSTTGIPVLWSDGMAETVSAREFARGQRQDP